VQQTRDDLASETRTETATDKAVSRGHTWWLTGGIGVLVAVVGFFVFTGNPVPAEDAAILFRYSENLAAGFGIVYNPGGVHVDGATDMLFMITLAALRALGLSVAAAAALVNATSLGLISALVFLAWRSWGGLSARWAIAPVALLLIGPVWLYGLDGFGTITFAAASCAVAVVSEAATRRPLTNRLVLLGLLVGLAGLIRPEGFILAPLIVGSQAIRVRSWRFLLVPAFVCLPILAMFVAWRTWYFGYPLPNTFYKKSGGALHLIGMKSTATLLIRTGLPMIALLAGGLVLPKSRRRAAVLLLAAVGWSLAWMLISDEGNTAGRFQYPFLPALLVLGAPLYAEALLAMAETRASAVRSARQALAAVAAVGIAFSSWSFVLLTIHQVRHERNALGSNTQAQVALIMRAHLGGGQRLAAVTEAGYVAWKSGWTVTDLWGLNDKDIAHHGYLSPGDIAQLSPKLIFAHVPTSNWVTSSDAGANEFLSGWTSMSDPLLCYTAKAGFVLIGQWGDGNGSFVVLVDPTLPDLSGLRHDFAAVHSGGMPNSASHGPLPVPRSCA
jgi:hypothetical protein